LGCEKNGEQATLDQIEWLNGYVNEQAIYGFEEHNEIFPMVTYKTPIS